MANSQIFSNVTIAAKNIGPGLLVTVGFIDPGNWASNFAAGSSYGYVLLWVVTLSTIMLIALQHNVAHLGIVTGLCLSEATEKYAPHWIGRPILVTAFMASISTSLAEILGAAIASVLCIIAPNIYIFNLMRIFQGLAGAGGIVISKSMSMDMFSGKELANFMAILGSINGIAPVCAPVIGGLMAGFTSWQGVFGLLLASAIFGTSGFVAGAISSPIVTMGTIEITSSIIMVLGTLLCLLLTLPLCKRLRKKR